MMYLLYDNYNNNSTSPQTHKQRLKNSSGLLWTLTLQSFISWFVRVFTAGGKVPGKNSAILAMSDLSLAKSTPASSKSSRMAHILNATSPRIEPSGTSPYIGKCNECVRPRIARMGLKGSLSG